MRRQSLDFGYNTQRYFVMRGSRAVQLPLDAEIARCDNCLAKVEVNDLGEIEDFFVRVEAGGVVPAGECPGCGALAYLVEDVLTQSCAPYSMNSDDRSQT